MLPKAPTTLLYLTAAVSGASVLVIEILGARILAPWVGTSHFVWTAQITVTLVALSVGYQLGGLLADDPRRPPVARLEACVLGAALVLALAVRLRGTIAASCLHLDLPLAAVLCSAAMFFVPLVLLAAVGPMLVRLLDAPSTGAGRLVGRLLAVSTLGSVAGAVAVGYLVVPRISNPTAMYLVCGALAALAVGHRVAWRRARAAPVAVAAAVTLSLLVPGDGSGGWRKVEEVYRHDSSFGLIQVLRDSGARREFLVSDYLVQDVWDMDERRSDAAFTWVLEELALGYAASTRDVLCIGLGLGAVPSTFAARGAQVDVVEIDPEMVAVAERHFGFDRRRVALHVGDGRVFLARSARRHDVIVLDAFIGDSIPSHLFTREALQAARDRLAPGGVLVINTYAEVVSGRDFLGASLERTLATVFPAVRVHRDGDLSVFYVATGDGELVMRPAGTSARVPARLRGEVAATLLDSRPARADRGMVLTDDFNPADVWDAPNREALRRRWAVATSRL